MSLILDALKRAERERKLGQTPAVLEEVAVPPPATSRKPGRRPVLLAVAALAIAALAAFAFLRGGHSPPEATPASAEFVEVISEPAAAAAAPVIAANPTDPAQDARIEDSASIASFDDLTDGEAPATADNTTTADPASEAGSGLLVEDGSTLVTPSRPPEPAPAPLAAAQPTASTVLKLEPKPPVPAPSLPTSEAIDTTVAEATHLAAEIDAAKAAPPGPIVRFTPDNINANAEVPPDAVPALAEAIAPAPTPVDPAPNPVAHPTPQPGSASALTSPPRLRDMPAAYRAEFPPLTIDVHVYNENPQRRFVLINGHRYREGEALAEGPRIAQIVPEGIVFDWRGEQVLYSSR